MYHVQTPSERFWSPEDEIWLRRGHTRKPNRAVIGLYKFFDLIQDFGPMFSTIFRGIRKTATGTWDFIVRVALVTVNLALLAGIIYLSVGHSYGLLLYAGFSGQAAWVAVAVWETVFVYCSIVIQTAYRRGEKSGWAAWAGFLMGWVFVEVSNYTMMANNPVGKAVGIATPILLLVMKKVLEHQFRRKDTHISWISRFFMFISRFKRKSGQPETASTSDNRTDTDKPVRTKSDGRTTDSNETDTDTNTNPDRQNHPAGHSDTVRNGQLDTTGQTDTDADGQADTDGQTTPDTDSDNTTDTDEQRDGHPDTEQGGHSDKSSDTQTNTAGRTDADTNSGQTDTDGHHVSDIDSDTIPDTDRQTNAGTPDSQKVSNRQISNDRSGQTDTDKPVRTKSNVVPFEKKTKQTNTNADTDSDIEQAKQLARDYFKRYNKHISIRKLAEAAGIKKHQAEKIRKELEQELTTVGISR